MMDKLGDEGLVMDGRKLFFEYSSRPTGGTSGPSFGPDNALKSGHGNHKSITVPSDWMCTICGCVNFARRTSCFQCNEPRTADALPADVASSNPTTVGKKGEAGPTHVLVVRGLDESADEEMLRYEFSKHAPIKDLRLVRDKFTHVSRGFAFLHFHTVEDATKALGATNGATQEKNGQILRVPYAKSILGPGSGPSGSSQSSSLAAAAIEAAAFAQQYDAVGWAPKEYNPDNKQPSGGQEPSGGEVAGLRMLIHYNLALFGMKHLAIIMMLLLDSIMMEIQSEKVQSEDTELEMGVALASLLSDPPIDHKCLGDNFSVSMIGDEMAAGLATTILDASIAPSLTWQYEEGFLSSSAGSGMRTNRTSTNHFNCRGALENMPLKEVFEHLKCTKEGLSTDAVQERLELFGYNKLEEKKESKILKFLGFMWNPLSWVMEAAALMAIALAHGGHKGTDYHDFFSILILLIINSTISFIEENNAGNAAAALMARLAPKAKVLRDGKWSEEDASVLVPGDIVSIKLGDIVPADARLLEGDPLKIDQPGMVTIDLLLSGASTKQVAEYLVPNIRSVPANGLSKPTYIQFLTGLKAYSQIFSRFAFGARRNRYLLED
ncbi:hypothetical protein TEA_025587 [Camellia sinensis var. sinensis]|uniref:RRM domain-containing protein n=1 Tax=Camellia sinensis var. sinensis TaxID=542762 RepID=A0A4S4D7K7_CAMSN|nr:hypothetical protein TEA_025587 [Camellia sinensis var. sinensis]